MAPVQEIRERAWVKLGEGNWLKAVSAFVLYSLIGHVISHIVARFGIASGGIVQMTLDDVVSQIPSLAGSVDVPPALMGMQFPVAKPHFQLLQTLLMFFWQGALVAGWSLFAVAMMRDGANPLQVLQGFARFFRAGLMMMMQSIAIALLALLFVIPGVIAFYSFRMSFFLMADHPDWSALKVLSESRRMMHGHRWRMFCLDASFAGWFLFVLFTFGLAAFFVSPYKMMADAAFYEDLLDDSDEGCDTSANEILEVEG